MVEDLAGLGKITDVIVTSLGKATGALAEPWQIRRVGKAKAEIEALTIERRAEAEAKAAIIRNEQVDHSLRVSSEETGLRIRAGSRLMAQEVRRQKNIESIVIQSSETARQSERRGARARAIEDDWISTFLEYCQNISNEDLQRLWAKILASQATEAAPSVSKATLDAIRLIEPSQAAMFERAVKLFLALGQIVDVDAIDGCDVGYQSRMLDSTALEDLGLLRQLRDLEASIDVRGGVLTFWKDEHATIDAKGEFTHWTEPGTRKTFLKNIQDVSTGSIHDRERFRKHIRVDRQILTSRGYELASILIPDFIDCLQSAYCTSPSLGDFSSRSVQEEILAQWVSKLSEQGAAVIFSHPISYDQAPDDSIRKGNPYAGRTISYQLERIFNDHTKNWESLG